MIQISEATYQDSRSHDAMSRRIYIVCQAHDEVALYPPPFSHPDSGNNNACHTSRIHHLQYTQISFLNSYRYQHTAVEYGLPCKLNAACFLSRITGESQAIICGCFTNHLMCFFFFYQQLWHGRGEDNATSPGCVTSRHLRLWIKESRWQPGSRRTSVQLSPFIKPVLLEHGTTNETPRSKSFINLTLSHRVGQLSSHYSNWTREQIVVFPNAHPVLGCVSMIYPFCTRAHCDPQI